MNADELRDKVQQELSKWVLSAESPHFPLIKVSLEADEAQAITLALWKLRLERPGWENYLKGISDKITPGQFAAYEHMHVESVTKAIERS